MSFPVIHKVALWITAFTGSLSTISSSLIIYMMCSDREFKLKEKPNNRILLSMSIIDVLQSIAYALHTIPMPASSGVFHAIGNRYSCAIQGFFIQLGLAVPAYNASLCIFYLMVIKYNMHYDDFAKKVEPFCHAYSILVPLSSACLIAGLDHFSERGYLCWISDGLRFTIPFIIFSIVQLSIASVVVIYCLVKVYYELHSLEQQMKQYAFSPSGIQWTSNSNIGGLNSIKKQSAKQISLFSFAFFMTFLFPSINTLFFDVSDVDHIMSSGSNVPLLLPQSIFLPLQGFWNMIIYSRPVVLRIMSEYPEFKVWAAIRMMIFHPDQVRPRISRRRRSSFNALRRSTIPKSRRSPRGVSSPISPSRELISDSNFMPQSKVSSLFSLIPSFEKKKLSMDNDGNDDKNKGEIQNNIETALDGLSQKEIDRDNLQTCPANLNANLGSMETTSKTAHDQIKDNITTGMYEFNEEDKKDNGNDSRDDHFSSVKHDYKDNDALERKSHTWLVLQD